MKLIIDIPEETLKYYAILANKGEVMNHIEKIIVDGVPLNSVIDDIMAEINQKLLNVPDASEAVGMGKAIAIIDKHIGKEKP